MGEVQQLVEGPVINEAIIGEVVVTIDVKLSRMLITAFNPKHQSNDP